MPTAEILSQGDEVVTGQIADTNAAWLSDQLTSVGITVLRHTTVGDRLEHIEAALRSATTEHDVVICTGGLGPTQDDLTAEACARAFQAPLALDAEALAHIEALYRRFDRAMPASNRKQAMLPAGATRLDNDAGTAPGFALKAHGALLACLPGVPREMKRMVERQVLPMLHEQLQLQPGRLITLRTTGVGESTLQDRIGPFSHPKAVLAYRTSLGENRVKLRFAADTPASEVARVTQGVAERIGSPLFAIEGLEGPGGSLPEIVGRLLVEQGGTLAVAESCSGGRLAALCTGVPGASSWFLEGAITYANAAKVRLGVPEPLLVEHGAVSEPVARAMAESVRRTADSTWGLSTTGIAGPGGGTPDKPVGTVHVALAGPDRTMHRLLRLAGSRERIQALTAHATLDLLRRALQGLLPASA